jgi:hypothetical protein
MVVSAPGAFGCRFVVDDPDNDCSRRVAILGMAAKVPLPCGFFCFSEVHDDGRTPSVDRPRCVPVGERFNALT